MSEPLCTLVSGAAFAPATPVPGSTRSVFVSLDGHLVERVPGIDLAVQDAAEIVRGAYLKWGSGSFGLLRGNYSFVVLDVDLARLFVVRDAAGTKPVYFSFSDHLVFGSSAIEVLRTAGLPAIADERALYRYLAQGAIAGVANTLLAGVQALGRAQYLEVAPGGGPEIRAVAPSIGRGDKGSKLSFACAAEALRCTLVETVKVQSSNGRVGVALSGGIDSSGIVASLRHSLGSQDPIDAFTFVHGHSTMPSTLDEQPWATLAARRSKARLHCVTLQSSSIPAEASRILQVQDFPFGSPVIYAQAEVFRVAADAGIKVMLSGHGPDVIFGGGDSHVVQRASSMLRRGEVLAAFALLRGASTYAASGLRKLMLSAAYRAIGMPGRSIRSCRGPSWARKSWFADRLATQGDEPTFDALDPMQQLILEQLHYSLVPTPLQWEECNARAQALDNRLPFLVPSMIDLAGRLPAEFLVSDTGTTKWILRHALRGMVPDAILDRRHSIGFAVPALAWLHEIKPWVDSRLRELHSLPFYDMTPASAVWKSVDSPGPSSLRAAFCIWRWLGLLEWIRVHNVSFR